MIKLYHYEHCPFCLRVRFALGLLNIPYESKVLSYADEETPLSLTGVKMLPIITKDGEHGLPEEDGQSINESLDIIQYLDKENILSHDWLNQTKEREKLENFLDQLASPIHNLCMPYWIYTKEFDEEGRKYFQTKKEKKRGPFNLLIQNKKQFLDQVTPLLGQLEEKLTPFYESDKLTIKDIMVASHIWGLYIFPEFQFSPKIHQYLQGIKEQTGFDYHRDLWLEN